MNTPGIKKIWQEDPCHFFIEWLDGKVSRYHLGRLQSHCPCRKCESYQSRVSIEEGLKAQKIVSVGNYGLRILFEKGCHQGIYTYSLLRQWDQQGDRRR